MEDKEQSSCRRTRPINMQLVCEEMFPYRLETPAFPSSRLAEKEKDIRRMQLVIFKSILRISGQLMRCASELAGLL